MNIQFHDSYVFIPFENACVLFNETEQSVLILNEAAAFIWCASFEASSQGELIAFVARQYDISLTRAEQDIDAFFDGFETELLFLVPEDKAGSFLKPLGKTAMFSIEDEAIDNKGEALVFSINHLSFHLSIHSLLLREEFSRIYNYFLKSLTLLKPSENIRRIEVLTDDTLYSIYVDALCVYTGLQLNEVVPFVFGIVFELLWKVDSQRDEMKLMFHAAVLGNQEGRMFLFPGESGTGKSTLSAMLAANQWQFFTDELAIVLPDKASVISCPLPICVKEGATKALLEYYPDLERLMLHYRLDDKEARYLPMKSPGMVTEANIQAIVFPYYDAAINCDLKSIEKREALGRLLNCGSSGRAMSAEELSSVMKMIEQLPCYTLKYSNIDTAVKGLLAV